MLTLKFPDHNVTLQVDADELTDDQVEEVYNHYFSTLDVEPGSPETPETRPDPTLTPEPQPTEPTFYKVPPEPPLPQETQAQTPAALRLEPSPSTQPPAIYTETREVPAPRIDPLEQVDAEVDAELEVSKIAPWDPSSFDETLDENPIFEGINKAIDTLSPFFMTAAEEKSMRAKHPNLMALRYSAASLLLPGVSEKFASPMELEAFTKKSTEDQRLEILGLTAGYAAFGSAGKGAQALLGLAAKKFPSLTKPIAQLFKDSIWFRRMTNRERGLVVQSIDDMKKAGLSEAEILRGIRGPEREKFFDAAMKDRGAGSVAEQPQKPKKLPDAEEIGETIAEESWKVTGGKLIKPIELTSKERLLAGAKKTPQPKPGKPQRRSQVRTLRGAIKEIGGINPLNFKGEVRNLPVAAKYLFKKDGVPIDTAVDMLRSEGWIGKEEDLFELLRSDLQALRRNKIVGEAVEKPESQMTDIEKRLKKETTYDPEEPPPGDYITINAEDLLQGQETTMLTTDGWDTYKVIEKDPFGITLEDGNKIELSPLDKVQVLRVDISRGLPPPETGKAKGEPAVPPTQQKELLPEEVSIFDEPDRAGPPKQKAQEREKLSALDLVEREKSSQFKEQGLWEPKKERDLFATDKERLLAGTKKAEASLADTGGYATGTADTGGYKYTDAAIIQLPEIVNLAKELMGGKYPKVLERMRQGVAGRFYPRGKGEIRLNANIFKDPHQAAATAAHEIGHLVDYIPDKTLKRGNILGRIASLKRYMKGTIPREPGGKGEKLTDKDRRRLKSEAKKLLEAEHPDGLIDEEIRKEFPVSPDDVLAIWTSAGEGAAKKNPELYEFIARLNTAEKKAVVKEALKGQLKAELRQFSKWVTEKTGKKIKWTPSGEMIKKKYEQLIKKELEKRQLFKGSEIMAELKALTQEWKPFDPAEDVKFTKYRYSGVELYADAFSAMMNSPGLVRSMAPRFYEAFFNYLENKPEVKTLYDQIQDDIRSGEVATKRVGRLRKMFRRGDDAAFSTDGRSIKDDLMRELVDVNWYLLKRIRKIGESTVPPGENPRYKMEELAYTGSEHEWLLQKTFRKVIKPLEEAGLTWDDFGELLYHNRVANERSEMANPQGWTPELSKQRASEIMSWSQEKGDAFEAARKAFRYIHKTVVDKIEESGMHTDKLVKVMKDADHYATFSVIDYIEKRHGKGPGGAIYRQIGTLSEILNPATATIMKDLAMIRSVNRNIAAESIVKFMRKEYGDEIQPGKKRWVNKRWEYIDTKDPLQGTVYLMKDGKIQGWYVPKEIAELFEQNPIEGMAVARILRAVAQPFRAMFTEYNFGFWAFNLIRDYWRAAQNLPKASLVKFLPDYMRGIKPAFKSAFGIPDPIIEEMQKGNMLISMGNFRGLKAEDKHIERLLKMYHVNPKMWQKSVLDPFGRFFTYYTNIGRAIERMPKVGGLLFLKQKFPELTPEELGHIIRTQVGSPDFLRAGRAQPIYNNLLLFSNAIKEGYRGDYEALTRSPASFIYKRVKYAYLPKMLMFAGAMGLLGAGIKRILDGATDYDKANYFIIPLGLTATDKSVYLRVPSDETNRFMGAIFWKVLNKKKTGWMTGLLDYMAGQAPTLNPGVEALFDVVAYATGQNPYDSFRGRLAIPERIQEAGGKRRALAFAKYLANKSGAGIVYRFKYDDVDQVKTELEKVLGWPLANNILGRFIKVSSYGISEQVADEVKLERMLNTREILDAQDVIKKILRGETLTPEDKIALIKKPDIIERNLMVGLGRKYGNVWMQEFLKAQTNDEKIVVIKKLIEIHNGQ